MKTKGRAMPTRTLLAAAMLLALGLTTPVVARTNGRTLSIAGDRAHLARVYGPIRRDASHCPSNVLYVSDYADDLVQIFPLTGRRTAACGRIMGLFEPNGLHVDARGNLWVAVTGAAKIVKFAPGASSPSLIIDDPGQLPGDVDVNAAGDRVAVTNIQTRNGGRGSISVFDASGKLVGSGIDTRAGSEYFVYIDASGNVFTTYLDAANTGGVSEFLAPKYRKIVHFPAIALQFPGDLHIAGRTFIVGDQQARTVCAYRDGTGKPVCSNLSHSGAVFAGFESFDGYRTIFGADPTTDDVDVVDFPSGNLRFSIPQLQGGLPVGVAGAH